MMMLPQEVAAALSRLTAAGYEAYVVGGAVRDAVRGLRRTNDWDITTSALPRQVEQVFSDLRCIETGLKHGTVTVVIDQTPLEITTFRLDGTYSDHRHPDAVQFTRSLQEDLARRDFTMNALAYSPRTGLVDLYGGQADLARGLVRCVGQPDRRFDEDALRILRALRFAAVFSMQVEEQTTAAVHRCAPLLQSVAAERVQAELTRLLCGPGAGPILAAFADVLAVPMPELRPLFGLDQRNPHHDRDLWTHTVAAVSAAPADSVLRWAALLHDVGKPDRFTLDSSGVGHFYGHAAHSASIADAILTRLRFDTARRERIVTLIRLHDQPLLPERPAMMRLLHRLGDEAARQLIDLHRADTLAQAPMCQSRLADYDRCAAMLEEILREKACFSLRDLAVNGRDMLALGLQGPQVGAALDACLRAVMDGAAPNERAALLTLAQRAAEQE